MTTYLLVYLCYSAALDDCGVYLHKVFEGPAASQECDDWLADNATSLPDIFVWPADLLASRCVSQPVGE